MDKTKADVEVIEKQPAFQGYFRVDRYLLKHRLHGGGWSGPLSREVFERGHVAAVVPYDPVRDEIVFIEQFRVGAYAALQSPWLADGFSPWLLEFVAGIIGDGETPEGVAVREGREETGLEITDLIPVANYLSSPGGCSEYVQVYCGRVDAEGAGGIFGLDHENEDIRVLAVPAAEAFQWLKDGRISNGLTLIALQWLKLNRDRVRRDWGAT